MKLLYNNIFLKHDTGMHPENKKRLESLGDIEETVVRDGSDFLELIHSTAHINRVKEVCKSGIQLDGDTMTSVDSYEVAIRAVGATIQAAENGDFALVRPPGHHAYPNHSSGFCLFNNIAIATQKLVNEGKKVLVFDFDGHLGDGTSNVFYKTKKVLYWSIHQYPAFPGHGFINEIGEGEARGFTINVPLPANSGDDIFMDAFNAVLPIARQFKPDVVAVSAGFDAHHSDPLLDLMVSNNSFYSIGKLLDENFEDIFATLEGGYNIGELPNCIHNFLDGINGKQQTYKEEHISSSIGVWDEYKMRMSALLSNLKPYWNIYF